MTTVPPESPPTPSTSPVPVDQDACLAVLGMLAYSELAAFSRLAADAALAPDLGQRLELSRLAGVALTNLDAIRARVGELGGDLQPVMRPFAGVLVEFDGRTVPSTWWERLLKGYVGYGVADDFSRMVAQALDPQTRDLVVGVLSDDGHAQLVVDALARACVADPTLASRLALWGRRLVGEALGVVQNVVADHTELEALLERAMADVPGNGDAQQKLFAALTAEHSRRMERLGLTP
ncbi:ferritin-like fold-containing protein [Actinotalea subterranea]|uniref:ferritin-like fold-containing protein n=1 Tax=Actinotalea subterranea TaxID=2607497 RepID=UPI0011EBBF9A|nr:ferritin-like fold-containing protein [Actinotalea subterranea]